jgi:mono/diheme cytochrome c family protein
LELFKNISLMVSLSFLSTQALAQAADEWESGEQIYEKICQHCHTQNVGPVLTGRNLPAIYFATIARNGLNAMPAFRPSELSAEDLEKVATYLSQLSAEDSQ